jgi:hypothetical protein
VCQQAQRLIEAHEFRLGEDRFMRNLAADAMSQEPIDLFSIPRPIVAPELISGEAEPNVERYLDARFLADLAAGGVCRTFALFDVAFRERPFVTASY